MQYDLFKLPLEVPFKEVREFINGGIYAVETGCSFAWTEDNFNNLSTLNIINYLVEPTKGRLTSIDNNKKHVDICEKELIIRGIRGRVEFKIGNSTSILPSLNSIKRNFFWLDSEEDYNVGESEYMYAVNKLLTPGVICIDDYGSEGSVKWRLNSKLLKEDADFYKEYDTATGLIIGFYR